MSNDLREIADQIEARNTDGFGKFYMYAALLNVVAVRNKTFEEALPKQTTLSTALSGVGANAVNAVSKWVGARGNVVSTDQRIQLELGEASAGGTNRLFYDNVSKYQKNFEVKSPNVFIVIKNMMDAYLRRGQLISMITGKTAAFALDNLQTRGTLYIGAGVETYEGMVVGNTSKGTDMSVNPVKGKNLTNMRASGADEAIKLTPPWELSIERGLEIMSGDEYLEVTPGGVRLRKRILSETDRVKAGRKK